ncbi:MAG: hypothetical protein CMG46_03135 [Candidatus Marinimicrobia bacterium]|nr:hypothetical protein [Candidatus Neomarinimicrobiota bacterium]|tara:strand:- start:642 stop:1232 length:591 start_codon:yes stop_codon:yes gene_type:complete
MFFLFSRNMFFYSALTLSPSLLIAQMVEAAEPAHEHGVGRILIASEGKDVEIELSIPGADAVGFEHTASSEDEKMAVAAAAKALRDVDRIITLSSEAMCRAEEIEVVSGLMDDEKLESNQSHEHEHEHEHENSIEEVHSEFIAHYHFHCEQPSKMTSAEIGFFNVFPSAHELEAEWITPRGQGAAELTAKSPNLAF